MRNVSRHFKISPSGGSVVLVYQFVDRVFLIGVCDRSSGITR